MLIHLCVHRAQVSSAVWNPTWRWSATSLKELWFCHSCSAQVGTKAICTIVPLYSQFIIFRMSNYTEDIFTLVEQEKYRMQDLCIYMSSHRGWIMLNCSDWKNLGRHLTLFIFLYYISVQFFFVLHCTLPLCFTQYSSHNIIKYNLMFFYKWYTFTWGHGLRWVRKSVIFFMLL